MNEKSAAIVVSAMDAVVEGAALQSDLSREEAMALAREEIEFLPGPYMERTDRLPAKLASR